PSAHPALAVVTQPMGAIPLGVSVWLLLCLVGLRSTTLGNALGPTGSGALGGNLLAAVGMFAFFRTGHSATLQAIAWDVVFVPARTIVYPWAPLLVAGNAFAGIIIAGHGVGVLAT